jgi:hypothetical protein
VTTTRLRAVDGTTTSTEPTAKPERRRVRHLQGHRGGLDRIDRHGWAHVAWDAGGPGMVGRDGLSCVAPGLLVYVDTETRVGP